MADSKVILEVVAEGKNIKVVQRQVEGLGSSINKSAKATDKETASKKKNAKATRQLSEETKNYNRGQKGVAVATANSTKAFSKQRDLVGSGSSGLVGAYATLAANLFAATAAFGALQRAAQVEQLEKGLFALGQASGIALQTLSSGLVTATGNAISLQQAMRSTAQIVSAGLDPSSVEEFGKAAKSISIALGRDTVDALDRLTRGVSKLEPELLDELGLFIRVDEAAEKYAQKLGKAASSLSNFERRLAFQNEALSQAEEKFGTLAEGIDPNPYDQLAATLTDLAKEGTTLISKFLEPFIKLLNANPRALIAALTILGRKVLLQVIGNLANFDKAFSVNLKSQKEIAKSIGKSTEGLKLQSKVMRDFTRELKSGNSTYATRKKVLQTQDTLVKRQTTRLANLTKQMKSTTKGSDEYNKIAQKVSKAEKALDAAQTRRVATISAVNRATGANSLAKNQNTVATIINKIQQGELRKALKLSRIAYLRQTKAAKQSTDGLKGFAFASASARVAAIGFSSALKVLGAAFLAAIPIIGQIILAYELLSEAVSFVLDKFKSEETKLFEEKLESLKETQKELAASSMEVSNAFSFQSAKIRSIADAYTALSNNIDQFLKSYFDLGTGGTDKERLNQINQYIEKNEVVKAFIEDQYGTQLKLAKTEAERVALLLKGLDALGEQARAIKQISASAKSLNESYDNLRSSYIDTTPFTELSNALDGLVQDILAAKRAGDESNFGDAILDKITVASASRIGLEDIKAQRDEAQAQLRAFDNDLTMFDQRVIDRAKANKKAASGTINKRGRKATLDPQLQARAEEMESNRKLLVERVKLSKEESTEVEKAVRNERNRVRSLDVALRTQKNIISQKKSELETAKRIRINDEEGIRARIALENEIIGAQITYNNKLLEEANSRQTALNYTEEIGAVQQELNKLEKEGKQNSVEFLQLTEERNALVSENSVIQAEINRLTSENADLVSQKVGEAKEELQVQQAALRAREAEQAYLKFAADISKKKADNVAKEKADRLAIQKIERQAARSAAGQSLTTSDELEFARTEQTNITEAANTEYTLAEARINLEYALLDFKLAVMEKELKVAKETGVISKAQYDDALAALEGISVEKAKQAALDAAAAARDRKIREAELAVTLLDDKVEQEKEQRAIDAVRRRAEIAENAGATQVAQALREEALAMERARTEREIAALKEKGLERAEKEAEIIEGIFKSLDEALSNTSTDGFRSGGAGAAAIAGISRINAMENANKDLEKALEAGDITQKEYDEQVISKDVLDEAKIEAARGILRGVAEDIKALGPEGELMSTVITAIDNFATAFATAFEIIGDTSQSMADRVQAGLAVAATVMQGFSQIAKAASDAKIRQYDNEIAAEKKRDGKSAESLARIKELEKKKEKEQRKAFELDKKMKIAQTVIATAQGAMAAYAAFATFPPLAAAAAAAVFAMGAQTVGMIQSMQFTGGGSSSAAAASTPTVEVGKRTSSVDLATSQGAAGELAYFRGAKGTGGPENFTPAFMGAKYRNEGGPTAGYTVGEQGPELFVPSVPGTIVPNDEIQQTPQNVNISINAIDSQGVEQVLVEQRGNIIGMIRDAANNIGEDFYEEIETAVYTPSSAGARLY